MVQAKMLLILMSICAGNEYVFVFFGLYFHFVLFRAMRLNAQSLPKFISMDSIGKQKISTDAL
jgi:hypothetical protein